MRHRFLDLRRNLLLTIAGVTLLACLATLPQILRRGPNVVTRTYEVAAERLRMGENPYAEPPAGADRFKYAPAFALAYDFLPEPTALRLSIWTAFNAFALCAALVFWVSALGLGGAWSVAAIALALLELDISLRYQQCNGLLAGFLWLGALAFHARRGERAGAWWSLGFAVKVLPAAFLGAALWPFRPRTWTVFFATAAVLFFVVVPFVPTGFRGVADLHLEWGQALARDLGRSELLDAYTLLRKAGHPTLARAAQLGIALVTALAFVGETRAAARGHRAPRPELWALGAAALLLLSSGSESPTFVLLAPAYAVLLARPERWLRWGGLLAAFFGTVVYTDLWPKAFRFAWQTEYLSKPGAAFLVWILCVMVLGSSYERFAGKNSPQV